MPRKSRKRVRLPEVPVAWGVDADGVLRGFESGVGTRAVEEVVAGARAGDPYDVVQCLKLFDAVESGWVLGLKRSPDVLREFVLEVLERLCEGASAPEALGLRLAGRRDESREHWHRDFDLAASVREQVVAGTPRLEAIARTADEAHVSESTVTRASKRFPGARRMPKAEYARAEVEAAEQEGDLLLRLAAEVRKREAAGEAPSVAVAHVARESRVSTRTVELAVRRARRPVPPSKKARR